MLLLLLLCFLILLLQCGLALLQDGCDLPLHEGPGHVAARQGAALPAWTEYFRVATLLLNRLGRAGETELVMGSRRALKHMFSTVDHSVRSISLSLVRNGCPPVSVHISYISVEDCSGGPPQHLQETDYSTYQHSNISTGCPAKSTPKIFHGWAGHERFQRRIHHVDNYTN